MFGKRDGVMQPWAVLLLLPYLAYMWGLWHLMRLFGREDPVNALAPGLWIGRRLTPGEVPDGVAAIVDLTCEFTEPATVRDGRDYRCFAVLDASVPPADQLAGWVEEVRDTQGLFIHCAQGHGRTGLFAACLLLRRGLAKTPEDALATIRAARPGARLGSLQQAAVRAYAVELAQA